MSQIDTLKRGRDRALELGDMNLAREFEVQLERYGFDVVNTTMQPKKTRNRAAKKG
jgi:hypothetical protein